MANWAFSGLPANRWNGTSRGRSPAGPVRDVTPHGSGMTLPSRDRMHDGKRRLT
jgi:hypothetical protein